MDYRLIIATCFRLHATVLLKANTQVQKLARSNDYEDMTNLPRSKLNRNTHLDAGVDVGLLQR